MTWLPGICQFCLDRPAASSQPVISNGLNHPNLSSQTAERHNLSSRRAASLIPTCHLERPPGRRDLYKIPQFTLRFPGFENNRAWDGNAAKKNPHQGGFFLRPDHEAGLWITGSADQITAAPDLWTIWKKTWPWLPEARSLSGPLPAWVPPR